MQIMYILWNNGAIFYFVLQTSENELMICYDLGKIPYDSQGINKY